MFCLLWNWGGERPEQRERWNFNLDAVNNSRIQDNTHSDEHTIFHLTYKVTKPVEKEGKLKHKKN